MYHKAATVLEGIMYAEIKCAYDRPSRPKTFRFEGNASGLKLSLGTENATAKYAEIRSRELRIDGHTALKTYNQELYLELLPEDLTQILDFAIRNNLLELTVRRVRARCFRMCLGRPAKRCWRRYWRTN